MRHAVTTLSTCNEACWEAREDICRCMCGGANHGLLRRDPTAPKPPRTKRRYSARFKLVAVIDGWLAAENYAEEHHGRDKLTRLWDHHTPAMGSVHVAAAGKSQLKWPEFQSIADARHPSACGSGSRERRRNAARRSRHVYSPAYEAGGYGMRICNRRVGRAQRSRTDFGTSGPTSAEPRLPVVSSPVVATARGASGSRSTGSKSSGPTTRRTRVSASYAKGARDGSQAKARGGAHARG